MYDEELASKYTGLFEWGRDQGIYMNPKLEYPVLFPPGYLGVRASSDLESGELLISVPNHMMFSAQVFNGRFLQPMFEENPELFGENAAAHDDYKALALMLWEQSQEEESFWHDFFSTLPSDPETIVDWTEEEILELQDPIFANDIRFRRDRENKFNRALHECLLRYPDIFSPEAVTLEKIKWNWKILSTRGFGDCTPNGALIPLTDFFNHGNVSTIYYYGEENEEEKESDDEMIEEEILGNDSFLTFSCLKLFKINTSVHSNPDQGIMKMLLDEARFMDEMEKIAQVKKKTNIREVPEHRFIVAVSKKQHISAGEEVKIRYGRYSNRLLLTFYGFSMLDNKFNYANLYISLREFFSPLQMSSVHKNYNPETLVEYKFTPTHINTALVKHVRALEWRIDENSSSAMFSPTSLSLEAATLCSIENFLSSKLSAFPTSIEEDEALLLSYQSLRHYFALVYRVCIKKILQKNLQFYQICREIVLRLQAGVDFVDAIEICPELETPEEVDKNRASIKEYLSGLKSFHNNF